MEIRATALRSAILLSLFSVVWGGVVGAISLILAFVTGSLSLLGFGVDALIDSAVSVALIWRFSVEGREPERATKVEHAAERIVGGVLLIAALSLALGAIRALLAHDEVETSVGAVVLLCASVIVLPPSRSPSGGRRHSSEAERSARIPS